MDRTAWIAVILCVAGLVLWEVYLAKQIRPKPLAAPEITTAPISPTPVIAPSAPAPFASPPSGAASAPAETIPPFQESVETLRNSDVELRLTNRGGGIAQAVLLNHKAEQNARVTLNSSDRLPIGAIIDNPAVPLLPEYKIAREGDAIRFERAMTGGVTIRKKFFYQQNVVGAEWVAVSNQFFTTLIAPLTAKANNAWARRFEIARWPDQKSFGIEGALGMPGFQLQPGQTYSARFEIYTGPKLYHRLAQLEHNEAEIMDFGMFKIVCQFLLNFMNLLHSWLGNYAAAILALTTIIKLVLWPIQNRANRSMRQMSALSPKMQELRDKYKDDPTRMNQEVMKLYKQYGINPVGGCLPMVIQIPIFFGLYKMLSQAVELRNAK